MESDPFKRPFIFYLFSFECLMFNQTYLKKKKKEYICLEIFFFLKTAVDLKQNVRNNKNIFLSSQLGINDENSDASLH